MEKLFEGLVFGFIFLFNNSMYNGKVVFYIIVVFLFVCMIFFLMYGIFYLCKMNIFKYRIKIFDY